MTTTPTERMIAMLQEQVATLTAERDEARRECCEWCSSLWKPPNGAKREAERRGWNCFKGEATQ